MFGNRRNHFINGYPGQMMQGIPFNFGRNTGYIQPYSQQAQTQSYQWQSYQPQNPYYPGAIQPVNQGYSQNYMQPQPQPQPYSQPYPQKDSQFLFQNPLQPQEEMYYPNQYPSMNGYPNMNPYPKQNMMPKQPGGMQSFMNSFKSQDGSVDFNKMMNTAGQMMTAVNQVSSLVKGLGGIFKA